MAIECKVGKCWTSQEWLRPWSRPWPRVTWPWPRRSEALVLSLRDVALASRVLSLTLASQSCP